MAFGNASNVVKTLAFPDQIGYNIPKWEKKSLKDN
jgi:hypothetical protein